MEGKVWHCRKVVHHHYLHLLILDLLMGLLAVLVGESKFYLFLFGFHFIFHLDLFIHQSLILLPFSIPSNVMIAHPQALKVITKHSSQFNLYFQH